MLEPFPPVTSPNAGLGGRSRGMGAPIQWGKWQSRLKHWRGLIRPPQKTGS